MIHILAGRRAARDYEIHSFGVRCLVDDWAKPECHTKEVFAESLG